MAALSPTGFETLSGGKVYYEEATRCNRAVAGGYYEKKNLLLPNPDNYRELQKR